MLSLRRDLTPIREAAKSECSSGIKIRNCEIKARLRAGFWFSLLETTLRFVFQAARVVLGCFLFVSSTQELEARPGAGSHSQPNWKVLLPPKREIR